jgi:hypothetical protein
MAAAEVVTFAPGGYRYVKGVFRYSASVAAEPGFEIERARFHRPVALAEGFRLIEARLRAIGRPLTAFCACELRSPAPFTEAGFEAFNRQYVAPLAAWGLYKDGANPVARSNVCPAIDPPVEPSFYAFSYTVPAPGRTRPSFIVAGGAEAPENQPNYRDHIVRRGDVSPDALVEKARYVLGVMEGRMQPLGCEWKDVTDTQAYTVHDLHPFLGQEIVRRGAAPGGLTWHYVHPPVVDLEFEMDARGIAREVVL